MDKKALKTKLLSQYENHLDDILDQVDDYHRFHISEIEEIALELRQEVGVSVTEALTHQESQENEVDVSCPKCHQRMRGKGRKAKWVRTQTGTVRVERPYYYCEACQQGLFPPR